MLSLQEQRVLYCLDYDKNVTQICKKTGRCYTYTLKTVHNLRKLGLLNLSKQGRECMISLTDSGLSVLIELRKIQTIMSAVKQ